MTRQTIVAALIVAGGGLTIARFGGAMTPCEITGQAADLEIVSVTIDGKPQADLSQYGTLEVYIQAPDPRLIPPPGVYLAARSEDNRHFQEFFDANDAGGP
jgi:hypothetical protein